MKLKEKYQKEVVPQLKEKFAYKNIFLVPKVKKVVINVGFGRHNKEKDYVDNVVKTLTRISGQKPVLTKAKNQSLLLRLEKDVNWSYGNFKR